MMKWQNLILWLHSTRFMINSVRKILISHQLPFYKCSCFPVGKIILVKTLSHKNPVALLDTVIATTDNIVLLQSLAFSLPGPPPFGTLPPFQGSFSLLGPETFCLETPHFPCLLIIDIISVLGSHGAIVPGLPAYSSRHCRLKITVLQNLG